MNVNLLVHGRKPPHGNSTKGNSFVVTEQMIGTLLGSSLFTEREKEKGWGNSKKKASKNDGATKNTVSSYLVKAANKSSSVSLYCQEQN